MGASEKEYQEARDFCKTQRCLRSYDREYQTFIVLLKLTFRSESKSTTEEYKYILKLYEEALEVIKSVEEETEDGCIFITEENCLDKIDVTAEKLADVVENELAEGALKLDEKNDVKKVVYP